MRKIFPVVIFVLGAVIGCMPKGAYRAKPVAKAADTVLITGVPASVETVQVTEVMPPETIVKTQIETVKVVEKVEVPAEEKPEVPEAEVAAAEEIPPERAPSPGEEYEYGAPKPPGVKYRVQIGAFIRKDNALKCYRRAQSEFGAAEVSMKWVAPFWKVFVGNYYTLQEAIGAKRMLRRIGYRDAFIVRAK